MTLPLPVEGSVMPTTGPLIDRFGRVHTYVRISVTDRCNFRCTYCMPADGIELLPKERLLSFEELARVANVFAGMGVTQFRFTGGEPTVRRGLPELVAQIAAVPGVRDLAMTTNGHLFAPQAQAFADAGLNRINVSIDTLDPEQFRTLTRGGDVARVLRAIEAARDAGITPIKLNAVIMRGVNEDQVEAMVAHFAPHAADTEVRFIEFMPFTGGESRRLHVPVGELRARLEQHYTLEPARDKVGGGPAVGWRIAETGQRIGFISPITEHFCDSCNRLRLQADGHLRTCLSRDGTPSLRDLLRAGATDETLALELRQRVWGKVAGHEAHLEGGQHFEGVMTSIGG